MKVLDASSVGDIEALNGRTYVFPQTNPKYAQALFNLLGYKDQDLIYSRFFYHKDHPNIKGDKARKLFNRASLMDWKSIEALQTEGRGAYFVVNGGGDTDAEVAIGRAIFCEWDNLDREHQLIIWERLGLPVPTIQVDTGGKSIHTYWIFDQPIPIKDWKKLQKDLAVYCSSDTTITNPSRVMRIPGCWHISADGKKEMSRIVSMSGQKYSYAQLRTLIPEQNLPLFNQVEQKPSWNEFNTNWSFPSSEVIPLVCAIKKEHRALIDQGESSGGRNASGFAIACDLIGTANYFQLNGQPFHGDAESLFYQYCQRCSQDDGWGESEWRSIWQSAQKGAKGPALSPEGINFCVRNATWEIIKDRHIGNSQQPHSKSEVEDEVKPKKSDRVELTFHDLTSKLKEIAAIPNYGERYFLMYQLAKKTGMPVQYIEKQMKLAISEMRGHTQTEEIDFFSDEEESGTEAIIPDFLYKDNVSMVVSQPGTGKSLLAYDFAYQLLVGGDFMDFPVSPSRVFVVQLDEAARDSKKRIVERIEEIYERQGITADEKKALRDDALRRLKVVTKMNFSDLSEFSDKLNEFKPHVVIIDNFREICQRAGIKENEQEAGEFLGDIKQAVRDYNSALLLIHHEVKSTFAEGQNKSSGHGSIMGQCAAAYIFGKPKKNESRDISYRTLSCIKNRLGDDSRSHEFKFVRKECSWRFQYVGETSSEARDATATNDMAYRILKGTCDYLQGDPRWTGDVYFSVLDIKRICGLPETANYVYAQLEYATQRGLLKEMRQRSTDGGKMRKYYCIDPSCFARNRKNIRIDELTEHQGFQQFINLFRDQLSDFFGGASLGRAILKNQIEDRGQESSTTNSRQFSHALDPELLEPLETGQFSQFSQNVPEPKKDANPRLSTDPTPLDHSLQQINHEGVVFSIGSKVRLLGRPGNDIILRLGYTKSDRPMALLSLEGKKVLLDDLDLVVDSPKFSAQDESQFIDSTGKPVFIGSKVQWTERPLDEFVVQRIIEEMVYLSGVDQAVSQGQIEALKDIGQGLRIGDAVRPNWRALKADKYPIKEMQTGQIKELPLEGESVIVTGFYSFKYQSSLCEGVHGHNDSGTRYSIDPMYWEKV